MQNSIAMSGLLPRNPTLGADTARPDRADGALGPQAIQREPHGAILLPAYAIGYAAVVSGLGVHFTAE
jgi:hypothetical protein